MNENEVLLNEKKMLKKMSNKTSITLLFFLGLTYALAIIAKLALEKIIINNQELQDAVYLGLAFFVQFVVCAPVAIMINNRKTKLELNKYFKKPKVKKAFVLKWIVIGMGLSFTINIILLLYSGNFPISKDAAAPAVDSSTTIISFALIGVWISACDPFK